jgi:DNA-binding transcriptional LysR family regulator
MELRHLRYFVAVAEEGSFTRAALRLSIQQPPLSQQVKQLEQELGFCLFDRHPRGVELTAGGTVFLEEARAILGDVQAAVRKASRAAEGLAGSVAVGFTMSVAVHQLAPALLREFRSQCPGVALEFREGNAAELTDLVAAGQIQAALLRAPVARMPELVFVTLLQEEMRVALPKFHTLADQPERPLALTALAEEPFILVRRPGAPGMYADLLTTCQQQGFNPRIVAQVEHMLTNLMLVAAGVGISVVPASMRDVHRERVVYRPLAKTPPVVAPITLVYRGEERNPAALHFLRITKDLGRNWKPSGAGSRLDSPLL